MTLKNILFAHTLQLSLWSTFSFDFNVALDFVKVIEKTWNGGAPLIISQLWTIISVSILIQWATFLYCYKSGRISPLTAGYPQPGPRQKVRHHTYLSLLQQSSQRELMGANSSCFAFLKSFVGISMKDMNSFKIMFREVLLKKNHVLKRSFEGMFFWCIFTSLQVLLLFCWFLATVPPSARKGVIVSD